jgi:hypothetical protein
VSGRYNLQSRFEADGVFWPADNKNSTFSAHLSAGPKRIEISRAAEVGGPERFFDDEAGASVLHGSTTLGPCTLIGLQSLGAPKSLHGPTGQVILAPRFRVSACVLGLHLVDEDVPVVTSGVLSYAGVGDWLRAPTQIRLTEEAIVISHPTRTPFLVDFCVRATKARVGLRVVSRLQLAPSGRHSASRDEPQVSIHLNEPASLAWFVDIANRFENFLSLCLGTSAQRRAVQVITGEGQEGWLVQRLRGKVERPDLQSWVQCTASQLAQSMTAWLSMPPEFRPLENLIYGTIRNSSMFVETEFLSLAQGLESLHRLTDSGTLTDKLTFKTILKALLQSIRSVCKNSALADRISDAIRYANEPSFKNRIESLIARISPEHARILLGDARKFEQALRTTRNFFTHPGIPKKTGVLASPKDIFLFNQKLHAFLRMLMLLYVGFPEDAIFEALRHQSNKGR